ncbi:MAG TPA: hydrolase 1, exosortase A system-associated [Allosphingosinicella sp.]|nr:hydrolase 1, exosortase A system-associated [Allosphingosinicella sp.]
MSFDCEGAELGATLDSAAGRSGLLLATGGSQTRIGSHRMYERLARSLAERGISCLRFDRRGVGDSAGEDPGFRGSGPDLAAAAGALRRECPGLERVHGFGLCDGATAIALFGGEARLDGLVLVNPWLVEAAADAPPPAAIRHHYRKRLLSREGWRKMLSGRVDYRKLLNGILKISGPQTDSPLAGEVASALARHRLPAELILAGGDATAIAAEKEVKARPFRRLLGEPLRIDSDSHTFARPGDEAALLEAVLEAVRRLDR